MRKQIKSTVIYLLIIEIMLLANILVYSHFSYLFYFGELINFKYQTIFDSFFVWGANNYSGLFASVTSPPQIVFTLVYALINTSLPLLVGLKVLSIFQIWIFRAIGAAGIFLLVLKMTKNLSEPFSYFGATISVIIFSMHFEYLFGESTQYQAVAFLPFVFLFIYLIAEKLNKDNTRRYLIYSSFLALALAFNLIYAGAAFFIQSLFLIFIVIFIIALLEQNSKLALIKKLSYPIVLAIVITLPYFMTTYLLINQQTTTYSSLAIGNTIYFVNNTNLFTALFPFIYPTLITTIYVRLVGIFGILIVVLGLTSVTKKPQLQSSFAIAFMLAFLIFMPLSLPALPLSTFIFRLHSIFPYIYIFYIRYGFPFFLFLFAALFGFSVANILSKFTGNMPTKRSYKNNLLIFIFVLFLIIYLYIVDFSQIGLMRINQEFSPTIPSYVLQISNYINIDNGNFAVATLPLSLLPAWQFTNWYTGVDIYSTLINHEVYTGGISTPENFFFPPPLEYYDSVVAILDNHKFNGSLSNVFGVLGIRYIIVEGDVVPNGTDYNGYVEHYNFNSIYSNLNSSKNIMFIFSSTNSSVYKNELYTPLIYGSDILRINSSNFGNIISTISGSELNIKNTSVFTPIIQGFYSYNSITVNITTIKPFVEPHILFNEVNPVRVTIHINNATTPYYLVFRETYDPHWAAFYSNGTEVNPKDHIAVNGFANAWYMNKTGNYTVTLYYTLQTDAWIAWGVSFAALFVTVGIGVYGWTETRKAKVHGRR